MAVNFALFSGSHTFMARVCDTIDKRIRCRQTQLDLDSQDGMYGMGLADMMFAPNSLKLIPPILPSFTSSARTLTEVSTETFGSTRAHSRYRWS